MKIVRNEKNVIIYPSLQHENRMLAFKESVSIKQPDSKYAHFLHTEYKQNKWSSVKFKMNKQDLQQYINELQVICDTMEVGK